MAHFRGTVVGGRSEASRLGHKTTGLTTNCNTWNLGVKVEADHIDGEDVFRVFRTGGSNSHTHPELISTIKSS